MQYEQIKKTKRITPLQKYRLNTIYRRLSDGIATKEELMQLINVKDDRMVRDCISVIKKKFPVISLSGEKGYRIAKTIDDLEDAKHMIASETSRAREVISGIGQVIEFVNKFERMEA